jgi:hypothetical protein
VSTGDHSETRLRISRGDHGSEELLPSLACDPAETHFTLTISSILQAYVRTLIGGKTIKRGSFFDSSLC